jgi:hypothetical protein
MGALLAVLLASSGLPVGASTPTAAFAADGTLWLAWVDGTTVYVGASKDLGVSFASAVPVNPEPEPIDANGEARPKIAVGSKGEVYVSYTRKLAKPYTGEIRFSRSTDGGRTFAAPITVNDDGLATGHRFDALSVAPNGDVHLVWIDKREGERAAESGVKYEGAALYEAVSTDGGATFQKNRKLKDNVCECCRLAVAWDGATPVLFLRDLMDGGVRDHSLARIDDGKSPTFVRATDDGWEIAGCPHAGPALAAGDGVLHLAWFTGAGTHGSGTFYRRSTDDGRTFDEPMRLGGARGTGRPQVLAAGRVVWVTWREAVDDETSAVFAVRSDDAGATWSKPREVARTRGESDHPLLLARGEAGYVSWYSKADGYRVIALE